MSNVTNYVNSTALFDWTCAQASWDDQGQELKTGKSRSRLKLGYDQDPRLQVAAKIFTDVYSVNFVKAKLLSKKFKCVDVKVNHQRILINVKSVAQRLHMTAEQVREEAATLPGEDFMGLLHQRADDIRPILDNYDKMITNFHVHQKRFQKRDGSNALTKDVQPSTLMKVITVALTTHQGELKNLKKSERKKHEFYKIEENHKFFYARLSDDHSLQLLTKIKKIAGGGFGTVYQVVDFNEDESLALKTALKDPLNSIREKRANLYLAKEFKQVEFIHRNGRVWGAQDIPKALMHVSNHADFSLGLMMPLYDTSHAKHYNMQAKIQQLKFQSLKIYMPDDYSADAAKNRLENHLFSFHQLLGCLKNLEDDGIVHGDIKSNNIVLRLRKDGMHETHMIDFAGATVIANKTIEEIEKSSIIRTSTYSPLEDRLVSDQLTHKQDQDAYVKLQYQRDIFSMGSVFYYELTGQLPFEEKKFNDLFYPDFSQYRGDPPDLPKELLGMLKNMLKPKADNRPLASQIFPLLERYIKEHHPKLYETIDERMKEGEYLAVQ